MSLSAKDPPRGGKKEKIFAKQGQGLFAYPAKLA
jgi:hypothetical protein